ncbi:MAG: hypothetical protein RBG13Loki_2014 [Promethearchaeota archaeon CR_4]|nr:MAG: hypothetical protein RBG13Loki_2014 [Candidatus Lokiarchaeota archaeon CR_4]
MILTEPPDLPDLFGPDAIQAVVKAMDNASEGFSTLTVNSFTIANHFFSIKSPWGRGGNEMVMITAIVQEKEPDFQTYERNFRKFEQTLKKDPDIFKAFYLRNTEKLNYDQVSIKRKFEDLKKYLFEVVQTFQLLFHTHGSLRSWKSVIQNLVVELPSIVKQDVRDFNLDHHRNCFVVYRKKGDAIKIDLIPVEGSRVLKVGVFFTGTLTPEIINELLRSFVELKLKAVFTSGLCVEGNSCVYEVYVDPRNQRDFNAISARIMTIEGINDVRITPIKVIPS